MLSQMLKKINKYAHYARKRARRHSYNIRAFMKSLTFDQMLQLPWLKNRNLPVNQVHVLAI